VNIDFSESVIEKMKPKHPEMEWLVMDMLDLKFDDRSFDVVIDKGASFYPLLFSLLHFFISLTQFSSPTFLQLQWTLSWYL
jgi:hypothetical protein